MDEQSWGFADEVDTREVYHDGRIKRQYETDVRSLAMDKPLKERVLQLLDTMKQETIATINVHLFAVGYMLYVMSNTRGAIITDEDLETCYNVVRDRCLDKDKGMVIRNIVKYMLYVKHIVGAL